MNFKNIDWNHVTRYSQLIAIVLFVGVFVLGFFLGKTYEYHAFINAQRSLSESTNPIGNAPIADVTYTCRSDKTVRAIYHEKGVQLLLSDGRNLTLPHAISASGARYANADESVVFWNKGDTAFITEGKDTTFADCAAKPILQ
jgi:membrane-bound inhibitor of C-type lysozyme